MNQQMKEYMVGEFEPAIEGLRDNSKSLWDRMYFMSATFGALNRVFNFEYDTRMVFAHSVLQSAHQAIISLITPGNPNAGWLDPATLDSLADMIEDLGESLVTDQSIESVLAEITELGFLMTGNGHYLHIRGVASIRAARG